MANYSKWKQAKMVPKVDIYARPLGKFSWTCPNCSFEHPMTAFPWRRGDVKCKHCHLMFRLGLGFSSDGDTTSAFLQGKWDNFLVNKVNPQGKPLGGAKLHGAVEWQCPDCQHSQRMFLTYDSKVGCEVCMTQFNVSLLIYKDIGGKRRTPFDLIVRGLNVQKSVQPLSAPSDDSSAGASSESTGGVS